VKWYPGRITEVNERSFTVKCFPTGEPPPKPGESFLIGLRKGRSLRHHRLYWAMLTNVVEATGRWRTKHELHQWILFQLKMFDEVISADSDRVYFKLRSTDFESMSQQDFNEYFEEAVREISAEIECDPLEIMPGEMK